MPELLIKLVLLNTKQDTSFLKLALGFELQACLSPSIRHLQAIMLSCSFSFVMQVKETITADSFYAEHVHNRFYNKWK